MKYSLLPLIVLTFSSKSLVAMYTPAEAQQRKLDLQKAFREHTGNTQEDFLTENSSGLPLGSSAKNTPVGSPSSPTASNFAKFMQNMKRLSGAK